LLKKLLEQSAAGPQLAGLIIQTDICLDSR